MQLLGVAGSVAFSLASAVVGVRLLILARRTRQAPETAMGAAFVSSGAFGFAFTVAADWIARHGGDPVLASRCLRAATLCFFTGYLGLAIGTWRIFRPGARWVRYLVTAIAVLLVSMAGIVVGHADIAPGSPGEIASWIGIATGCFVFAWAGVESALLFSRMRKRQRLGLVEPAVVDRVRLWGIGMFGAWAMTVHALAFRLATGMSPMQDGHRLFSSGLGMIAAVAIWLAFFPPAFYRRRFAAPAQA